MIKATLPDLSSGARAKFVILLVGLIGLAAFISGASIAYARGGGATAAIWPMNAVFLALTLRAPRTAWATLLGAMFVGNLIAKLGLGDAPLQSVLFVIANTVEVTIMAWAMRRRGRVRLFRRATIIRFIAWAPLASLVSTGIALSALLISGVKLPWNEATLWFAADTLGLLLFTPILWILLDRHARSEIRASLAPMLPELALVLATAFLVFVQSRYPLLFLIPPAVVFIAFRRGLVGAALGVLVVGAIGVALTFAGHGPTTLIHDGITVRLLVLQLFLATNALAALAVGAATSEKRKLIARLKRSRSSLALRSGRERLLIQQARLAERMSQVGYWKLTPASGEVYWSPEVYRIHGETPETFNPSLGDALQFYPADDRQRVTELIQTSLEARAGWSFEADLMRADGSVARVRSMAEVQLDGTGEVATIFGVFKDITSDHEMLEKVREQEALYRLLADNSTDVIARFGLDSVFTYLSPSIKPMLGYEPEELVGKSTSLVIHPHDFKAVVSAWRRGLATGQPFSVEYRAVHRDGTIKWLEARPSITRDETGAVIEIIDTVRDVSDRHEREVALAAATEAAQEATRAKGAFLSNMSHEIRTPLNGVIGFADLLSSASTDEERARFISRIQGAGQALLHVVNDILDFSKIEAGKMTVERIPYDPSLVAAEVVDLVGAANASERLVFTHAVEPEVAGAYLGDPARIRQVLINIVGNAAKFTREGAIDIKVARVEGGLGFIVTDNGPGIPADKLSRVFEGFSQADESVARNFGGTGLGLSISRSLARLMGGDVQLSSVLGQGTVATLVVPWLVSDRRPLEAKPHASTAESKTSLRVMVVDDVEMNRELVERGLGQAGLVVESHASAESAIAALRSEADVDVILMDVQMPGMDGLTATREIRRMSGRVASIPIIGLTANVLPEQAAACRAAGMDDHIGKPIDMHRLVERLERIASQIRATGRQGAGASKPDGAMEALKQRYAAHLLTVPAQLREIASGEDPVAAGASLAALAHSIAGTSGSLGFTTVSDAAFQVEAAGRRVEAGGPMQDLGDEIEGLIKTIKLAANGTAAT